MRESASTDLREPQGSNPLGPPGPELQGPLRRELAATALRAHLRCEQGGSLGLAAAIPRRDNTGEVGQFGLSTRTHSGERCD